ncbi:hypothetical protein P3W85_43460 [Cupriavidus basilensis]|uniref:N-acetyltransferase domain-containing protein n=1 Tax=Cupriavidus basilensis TaxID=68895 RepID=A0ABT6B4E0_9BURK|nr:hypothetical protein [Cupriavidus basilensis]MDF3839749.1 hypothetical protein [Cupriavidus basilensis]
MLDPECKDASLESLNVPILDVKKTARDEPITTYRNLPMRPRQARPTELAEIEQLLTHCPVSGRAHSMDHIDSVWVVPANAGLLACVQAEIRNRVLLLSDMAMVDRAHAAGLGELLLAAVIRHARLHGAIAAMLATSNAEEYFVRIGFQRIVRLDPALSELDHLHYLRAPGYTVLHAAL